MTEEGIELLNRLEQLDEERVERNRVHVLEVRVDACLPSFLPCNFTNQFDKPLLRLSIFGHGEYSNGKIAITPEGLWWFT
jgi:hypothetical protein